MVSALNLTHNKLVVLMSLITSDDLLKLEEILTKQDSEKDELEIRVGTFAENRKFVPGMSSKKRSENQKFIPGTTRLEFERILTDVENNPQFKNKKVQRYNSVVFITISGSVGIRKIVNLNAQFKRQSSSIEKKTRKKIVDMPGLDIRIALATEEDITRLPDSTKFNFFRFRNRVSIIVEDMWRWDFTKSYQNKFINIDDFQKQSNHIIELLSKSEEPDWSSYEIELEWVGKGKLSLEEFTKTLSYFSLTINPDALYKKLKSKIYTEIYNIFDPLNYNVKSRNPTSLDFTRDLINKPKTLMLPDFPKLEVNGYSISPKADGERMLLYISANDCKGYLINSRNEVLQTKLKMKSNSICGSLIDGEFLNDKSEPLYLAFDMIFFEGNDVSRHNLKTRLDNLSKTIPKIKNFNIELKKHDFISDKKDLHTVASHVLDAKRKYPTDGLIFTPAEQGYKNNQVFKWKPEEQTTIDFLIRKVGNPTPKTSEYHLYVGINRNLFTRLNLSSLDNYSQLFPNASQLINYFPIHFTPQIMPNAYKWIVKNSYAKKHNIEDNTIVELSFNPSDDDDNPWEFLKFREDKTKMYQTGQPMYGNNWATADANINSVLNPVTEKMIRGKEKLPFFIKDADKNSSIKNMRKFHNHIKSKLYKKYAKKNLLEIAAGKFGDLRKWIKSDIKNVYAIDIDKTAIDEGLIRVQQLRDQGVTKIPEIKTGVFNVKTDKWKLDAKKNSFDTVSIMFAIHFFLESPDTFERFVNNIDKYIKPKGYVMITTSDGKKVYDLLHSEKIQKGETLDLKKNNKTVFSIKKDCECQTFADTGQQVAVFVESIGSYHKEYLVNFKYLIDVFLKHKYTLIQDKSFEEYYKKWDSDKKLSSAEKTFSFLNKAIVFQKK